jgi:hypothetical protein
MRKSLFITLLVIGFGSFAFANTEPELKVLDGLRTLGQTVKVSTRIEVYEQKILKSQSSMSVYVGGDQRSLAVYTSEREAGQKVLMIEDKFWLFLPSSKRAMRITAMQKMMGEASVGDVASLAWSEDYDIVDKQEEGEDLKLELVAARKGLSYSKVTLWVEQGSYLPIKADLYLKSGKLAKQALFELIEENGQWIMTSLSLQDRVQKDQMTKIFYDQIEPLEMQNKWFTPQYLLRSTP